jgi:hypothetical protein
LVNLRLGSSSFVAVFRGAPEAQTQPGSNFLAPVGVLNMNDLNVGAIPILNGKTFAVAMAYWRQPPGFSQEL